MSCLSATKQNGAQHDRAVSCSSLIGCCVLPRGGTLSPVGRCIFIELLSIYNGPKQRLHRSVCA